MIALKASEVLEGFCNAGVSYGPEDVGQQLSNHNIHRNMHIYMHVYRSPFWVHVYICLIVYIYVCICSYLHILPYMDR